MNISAGKVPKTVEFDKGENVILFLLLPVKRFVSFEFILKEKVFSPQLSDASDTKI